jgi:hypothetical protein
MCVQWINREKEGMMRQSKVERERTTWKKKMSRLTHFLVRSFKKAEFDTQKQKH